VDTPAPIAFPSFNQAYHIARAPHRSVPFAPAITLMHQARTVEVALLYPARLLGTQAPHILPLALKMQDRADESTRALGKHKPSRVSSFHPHHAGYLWTAMTCHQVLRGEADIVLRPPRPAPSRRFSRTSRPPLTRPRCYHLVTHRPITPLKRAFRTRVGVLPALARTTRVLGLVGTAALPPLSQVKEHTR